MSDQDTLGIPDPDPNKMPVDLVSVKESQPKRIGTGLAGPGRPKGVPNKAAQEIKRFAQEVLESEEYRTSLKKRLKNGDAPHMETLLHHYAYGKPVDRIAVAPTTADELGLKELSNEELAARAAQLAREALELTEQPAAN